MKLEEKKLYQKGINPNDVAVNGQQVILTKIVDGYAFYETTVDKIGEVTIGKVTPKIKDAVKIKEEPAEVLPPAITEPEEKEEKLIEVPVTKKEESEEEGFFSKVNEFFRNVFR